MSMEELPKKILMIKDLTFILPDDFHGSVEDAFTELLKYRDGHLQNATYNDPLGLFSSFNLLVHSDSGARVCGHYGLYEYKNHQYQLIDGTIKKDENT